MRQFIFLAFIYFSYFSLNGLFAQKQIEAKYTSNVDSPIDSSTISEIMNVEIETDFKTKLDTIYHDVETKLNIFFLPKSGSHLLLIKESAIPKIKKEFAMKFNLFFYDDNKGSINTIDSLFLKLEFAGHSFYAGRSIDTIRTMPIKIMNKCSKVKYMQFNQIQIIKAPPIIKSEVIIPECDTNYYPVEINSSPPGAQIYIDDEDIRDSIVTPFLYDKNKKPSLVVKLKMEGYEPYSGPILDLKPNVINHWSKNLERIKPNKYKEAYIFGGTAFVYALIWYGFQSKDNAPPKIPSPADFRK